MSAYTGTTGRQLLSRISSKEVSFEFLVNDRTRLIIKIRGSKAYISVWSDRGSAYCGQKEISLKDFKSKLVRSSRMMVDQVIYTSYSLDNPTFTTLAQARTWANE